MHMLQVKNGKIVDQQGKPIQLRSTGVGGWMNMENFIDGYPGAEGSLRATMAQVLGPAKAQFFFERLLDYFFAEDDIAFLKACGATVVRLPLNYRHFEHDAQPFHYRASGFARLDQVLQWCTKHGLYVILDLHAVQGWQNTDWHADNTSRNTLFWEHPHFQDRYVALWEEFARRYKGNATIAGYDIMNEPVTNAPYGLFTLNYTPNFDALNRIYRRTVAAIRAIDPDHIIFLEGDLFATRFCGLEPPFADNLAYSSHDYNDAGFGPGPYPGVINGTQWNKDKQLSVYLNSEGTRFSQQYHVPLWSGEFGSAYNGPVSEEPDRLRALDDLLAIFEQFGTHWTTWTYKDVGAMGWVVLDPQSAYLQLLAPILAAKRKLRTDFWMHWLPATPIQSMISTLSQHIQEVLADSTISLQDGERFLTQATLDVYAGTLLQHSYAARFKGMSETDIDNVLQSFAFKNCQKNEGLLGVVKKHML